MNSMLLIRGDQHRLLLGLTYTPLSLMTLFLAMLVPVFAGYYRLIENVAF